MDFLPDLGRWIFGGYFVIMGLMHFMKTGTITRIAAQKNVPAAKPVVLVAGFLLLAGGFGVIFQGLYLEWAVLAIIIFLLPAAFKMHNFWAIQEESEKRTQMELFLRNIALTGAVLMLL